ncbi:MAG: hypothetical protein N2484_13385 [Clostridia bacterium]|nr:hypothetical protein [Clostridia bacterium]
MKQRITWKDLAELDEDKKQQLNDLWIPSVFDAAVATVCTDVEEEEYEHIIFVIGGIQLYNKTSMILHDIKYIESQNDNDSTTPSNSEEHEVPYTPSNRSDNLLSSGSSVKVDDFAFPTANRFSDAVDQFSAPLKDSEMDEVDEAMAELDFEEGDIEFGYTRPTAFNKEDCLPLLTIGQMIEILEKKGFGYGDFYLAAGIHDVGCEIGKTTFDVRNYGSDYEKKELCDVLWEYVKTVLE